MANRCYLYAISDYPESTNTYPEVVFGIGDQPYAIPFLFRLLISGHTRCVNSLLFEAEDPENGPLIPALLGDGAIGFA